MKTTWLRLRQAGSPQAASPSVRARLRLPRASASLGRPAVRSAPVGHTARSGLNNASEHSSGSTSGSDCVYASHSPLLSAPQRRAVSSSRSERPHCGSSSAEITHARGTDTSSSPALTGAVTCGATVAARTARPRRYACRVRTVRGSPRRAALRLSRVRTARLPPGARVNTAPRVEAAQAAPRLGGDAADEAALRGDPTRERVLWRVGREGERAEAKHKSAKRHALLRRILRALVAD